MWKTGRRHTGAYDKHPFYPEPADRMFAEDRAAFISALDDYSLLILDDLGVEQNTEYALEQMFLVIDSRYRSRKPPRHL